jgi:hypothetical protein
MNTHFASISAINIAGKTFNRLFVNTPTTVTPPNAPSQIKVKAILFASADLPANLPQGQQFNVAMLPDTVTRTIQLTSNDVSDVSFAAIADKVIEVLGVTVA